MPREVTAGVPTRMPLVTNGLSVSNGMVFLLTVTFGEANSRLSPTERSESPANGRNLTNLGTFRAYCVAYLKANPGIHRGMTLLVRQLDPKPTGIPLEIYVFTNDTRWANYENIQSDIFDHLLAVISEFGLAPYQEPSGRNFEKIAK